MNQQSKKILFNKSTLLSLKAELLKKQDEVKGKKQLPQHKVENHKPSPQNQTGHAEKQQKKFKDNLKEIDTDELEACKRSKSALEKKAELYKHLSDSAGSSELADRFLVDFGTKKNEEKPQESKESEEQHDMYDDDDDDEWMDYADCLGRIRRCLKTDVELYKRRDRELMRSMQAQADQHRDTATEEEVLPPAKEEEVESTEKPLLVQTTNDYLQSLRQKWEQKEQELVGKDRDIHYQDLLFDEARSHGVGYYGFSTEETARRREQAELQRTRVETQRAQEQAAARRAERDALVAARVTAARARQRARAGLPPEEPDAEKKDEFNIGSLLDFLTEKKKEATAKAKEEERRAREEREQERQKLRENFVREWDVGKEGMDDKKEGFREMTQEEYEEQQRSKRIQEFAPPQVTSSYYAQNYFDDSGSVIGNQELHVKKSWSDVRPNVSTQNFIEELPTNSNQGLYFSSVKESSKSKYPNFIAPSQPTPIVNEIEESQEKLKQTKRNLMSVEIEPPPTYDYYGPSAKKSKSEQLFKLDAREAFEKGMQFLQTKESKKNIPKDFDFVGS